MKNRLLFHRKYGSSKNSVLILHGLFGSSQNWHSVSKILAENYSVYAIDLRNHGQSFHDNSHSVNDMADDIHNWIQHHKISDPVLIGHSMGGLTAMKLALEHSSLIRGLVIADIAPRSYVVDHQHEFKALLSDISICKTRKEIDHLLEKNVSDKFLRGFLMTNIIRENNQYLWKLNVNALYNSKKRAEFTISDKQKFEKPALFITAEISNYVTQNDHRLIQKYFTNSKIITIALANHYLHVSAKDEFISSTCNFLESVF